MIVYHAVTERPMYPGQKIIFDSENHSGVYGRVMAKLPIVNEIYAAPDAYPSESLEHHTAVALRELAMEEVRNLRYSDYPSRMSCLYVSRTYEEAENWADYFASLGRPTYHIVKMDVNGRCFMGDARKCFRGTPDRSENLRLAEAYWSYPADPSDTAAICELLVDGEITVLEIVKEINANL